MITVPPVLMFFYRRWRKRALQKELIEIRNRFPPGNPIREEAEKNVREPLKSAFRNFGRKSSHKSISSSDESEERRFHNAVGKLGDRLSSRRDSQDSSHSSHSAEGGEGRLQNGAGKLRDKFGSGSESKHSSVSGHSSSILGSYSDTEGKRGESNSLGSSPFSVSQSSEHLTESVKEMHLHPRF